MRHYHYDEHQSHFFQHMDSPLGRLQAQWTLSHHTDDVEPHWALRRLDFVNSDSACQPSSSALPQANHLPARLAQQMQRLEHQLGQYFAGHRQTFDIPLLLQGTAFQRLAWQELQRIEYGQTIGYAEQASRIGKPTAVRAVANANGKNPISIIVPCHRVVRSDGSLGGYTGGIDKKQVLLTIEGVL